MKNEYKIINIPSEFEVVISGGSNNGIKMGDTFQIYIPGEKIYDPDTKELLGTLDRIKSVVEATSVLPKMTVCQRVVKRYTNANIEALQSAITVMKSAFFQNIPQGETVQYPEKLEVKYEDISGIKIPENKEITLGDKVRKIITE